MPLTILLLGSIVSSGFSQISTKIAQNLQTHPIPDTTIQRFKDEGKKNQVPNYGMPNAIQVKPQPNIYKGNNGQGFDIYESPLDNMAILKPDSSFASNMPSPKKYGIQQTPRILFLPENIIKQNDTVPSTKFLDLLLRKQWQPNSTPKK